MIEQEEGLSPLDLIFQRFLLLSRLAEEDGEEWKTLCQDAWFQIVSQKRPSEEEPTPERENLLFAAAAALAFYQYSLIEGASGGEEVSLGDMKVSQKSGNLDLAWKIWDDARARAADLLRDEGFYFERMGGRKENGDKASD